uniref:Helicase C-terminal domain-containing protein n=1 Tax=Amphimedon queenslandica TaxID=400682 RepID=A0A1X7VJN7_AMPQE
MYFKGTDPVVKVKIVTNYTTPSCLKVLICTDAFGMGIDCRDIKVVIHYGVPGNVETYV